MKPDPICHRDTNTNNGGSSYDGDTYIPQWELFNINMSVFSLIYHNSLLINVKMAFHTTTLIKAYFGFN